MRCLPAAGWRGSSLLRNMRYFTGKAKDSYQVRGALAQLSDVNFNEVSVGVVPHMYIICTTAVVLVRSCTATAVATVTAFVFGVGLQPAQRGTAVHRMCREKCYSGIPGVYSRRSPALNRCSAQLSKKKKKAVRGVGRIVTNRQHPLTYPCNNGDEDRNGSL